MSDLFSQMDAATLVVVLGLVVMAFVLLYMLAGLLTGGDNRMRRRLARIALGTSRHPDGEHMRTLRRETADSSIAGLDRLIKSVLPRPAKLRDRLAATGRRISIGEYVLASLVSGILTFGVCSFFGLGTLAAAMSSAAVTFGLPHMVIGTMVKRRRNKFMVLLPEAIDLIVRGLRSGLPITESIKVVGAEIPDPVGVEFRRIVEAFAIGQTLEEALAVAAERIGVAEFRFFVISLSVQQETGGNLTETLENLGSILRKRKQMKLKIRALTGEARASAMILSALPFVNVAALLLTAPKYLNILLTSHTGHFLIAGGVISMSIGIGTMYRMTKFEI